MPKILIDNLRLTTRNDFNPVHVIGLIQSDDLTKKEAIRILEEACHVIVKLKDYQSEIQKWEDSAPWRRYA